MQSLPTRRQFLAGGLLLAAGCGKRYNAIEEADRFAASHPLPPQPDTALMESLPKYVNARYDDIIDPKSQQAGQYRDAVVEAMARLGFGDQMLLLAEGKETPRLRAYFAERGYVWTRLPDSKFSWFLAPMLSEERKQAEFWGKKVDYIKRRAGEPLVVPQMEYRSRKTPNPDDDINFSVFYNFEGSPKVVEVYTHASIFNAGIIHKRLRENREQIEADLKDSSRLRQLGRARGKGLEFIQRTGRALRYRIFKDLLAKGDNDAFISAVASADEKRDEVYAAAGIVNGVPLDRVPEAKRELYRTAREHRAWLAGLRYADPHFALGACLGAELLLKVNQDLFDAGANAAGVTVRGLVQKIARAKEKFPNLDLTFTETKHLYDGIAEFPKLEADQIRELAESFYSDVHGKTTMEEWLQNHTKPQELFPPKPQ